MGAPQKPQPGWLFQILMPLLMLTSVGLVMVLIIRPGGGPSPLIIGGILVLIFAWIGVSVLWPARADRSCPQCKADALERMNPQSAVGLLCKLCGWSDDTASGWYLAEEEMEALEPLAMERRRPESVQPQANMDKGRSSD